MLAKTSAFNRKEFVHDFIDFETFPRVEVNGVRYYKTRTGNLYPSVTTVLGKMSDKTALEEWKKRVGEAEAARVSAFASSRGTKIHSMCEDYVLGLEPDLDMPAHKATFMQVKKVLDESIDNVRALECTLISDNLQIAGTCDLVAEYNGDLAIIDYKTSAKYKKKEWIEGYFMQASLYSYMLWEMTGIQAKKIVIIIAVDDSNNPQVSIEDPRNYIEKAADLVRSYHKLYK